MAITISFEAEEFATHPYISIRETFADRLRERIHVECCKLREQADKYLKANDIAGVEAIDHMFNNLTERALDLSGRFTKKLFEKINNREMRFGDTLEYRGYPIKIKNASKINHRRINSIYESLNALDKEFDEYQNRMRNKP